MLKRQIFSRNLYGKVFHFYKNYTVWASLVAQGLKKKKKSAYQCRSHRFNPWPGRIPQAVEHVNSHGPLIPWTTTTEPVL